MRDDNINDGGPAFPANSDEWDNDAERYRPCSVGGMSLRDYFAAKAMQVLIERFESKVGNPIPEVVEGAYQYADAMLKARQS